MMRYLAEYFDLRVFLATLALVAIGLVSIYSATYDARASEIFWRQLTWGGIGLAAFLVVTFLPLRTIQYVALGAYALSVLMLVIVLLLGKTVAGSTSWFTLGSFGFQPSEFAKVGTILALAAFLSRSDISLRNPKHLALTAGIVVLPVLLVMMQPDTGTALIFMAMAFPVLYWGGASRFTLLALVAAPAVALLIPNYPRRHQYPHNSNDDGIVGDPLEGLITAGCNQPVHEKVRAVTPHHQTY